MQPVAGRRALGATAYHAWLIAPTDGGCHVTEETQQGPFWEELAKKMPDGLHHFHQEWVEQLAEVAETDAALLEGQRVARA